MEVTLKRMGNSTALVMPPQLLKDLGLAVGRSLRLSTTQDGSIVLEPKQLLKHKYRLADMIAQCDASAPAPADMAEWDGMPAAGGEVW